MQDGKKPIIQSVRDYVMTYPDIDDRKINIDYLGNGMEYSIDPVSYTHLTLPTTPYV